MNHKSLLENEFIKCQSNEMFGFSSVICSVKEINSSLETPQAEIWSTFSAKYG